MAKFIKQSDFDALQARSDEIKKELGINSLEDEMEYAMSQPGFPLIETLITVPDDEWDKTHEGLDWPAAMKILRSDENGNRA